MLVKLPVRKVAEVYPHKTLGQPPSPSATNSCHEEEEEEEEGEGKCVKEDRDWEVDPWVPKTNKELLTKLAKLDAGHVKILGRCAEIPYRDTAMITSMVQDQGKREELKKVFHQLGLSLHTEDGLQRWKCVGEPR